MKVSGNISKLSFEDLSSKEWIITNGIGGYASSSVIGLNSRRYHGILIASKNPPADRMVMVSKVEEKMILNNREYQLSTNQYADTIYPDGYRYITHFNRSPFPQILYEVHEAALQKTVFMVHESNTSIVEYTNTSNIGFQLWLNPLYAGRGYHSLLHERENYEYQSNINSNYQSVQPHTSLDPVFFRHTAGFFAEGRTWNKQLKYVIDEERGHDCTEDVFSNGYVSCMLAPGATVSLIFSMDERMMNASPAQLKAEELQRLRSLAAKYTADSFLRDLIVAGDQFIVQRKSTNGYTIIAGYHWFTDWGRDSMIAVRGLCIATGKQEIAASIIKTFLEYLEDGVIPNRFPDDADELREYITIDATLWLFVAVYDYDLKFNDDAFLQSVFSKLTEIIQCHIRGTKNNIRMLENGLIAGGTGGIPLTWMDARIGEYAFTP